MVDEVIRLKVESGQADQKLDDIAAKLDHLSQKADSAGESVEVVGTRTRRGFGPLKNALDQATGGFISLAQGAINAARAATVGMNGMKAAIIGTGVGALIVGIGLAVEYLIKLWDKYSNALKDATAAQQIELEKQLSSMRLFYSKLDALLKNRGDLELAEAKKRGASEKELHDIKMKNAESQYEQAIKKNEIESENLANQLLGQRELEASIKDKNSKEFKEEKEKGEKIYKEYQAVLDARQILEDKYRTENQIADIEFELSEKDRQQKDAAQAKKDNEARNEESRKEEEKNFKKRLDSYEDLLDSMAAADARFEAGKKAIEDALRSPEPEKSELEKINEKYQRLLESAEYYGSSEAEIMAKWEAAITENAKNEEAQRIAVKKSANDIIQQQAFIAVANLANLFGQETKAGKALALASIAANTAIGFVQGLRIAQQGATATGPAAPYTFPVFLATQFAAVLGAASQAKSILQGGGSGGFSAGSFGGAGSFAPPSSITIPGQSGINSIVNGFGQNNAPVLAYVISGQVSSAQELERKRLANATFG